jgi:hypothetical protein
MSKLNKALLQAQYSQLWDVAHGMSEMWEGEPVLSKIWRVSKDHATAMLGTTDVITVEGGVDASELTLAIMQLGYPFAVVNGHDVDSPIAKSFVYVWDASDGGELKADLVRLAHKLNQDTVMFQSVDGDYQLMTCAEGEVISERSLGKEAFGVLNGHFYKVVAGRPFELDGLAGMAFE